MKRRAGFIEAAGCILLCGVLAGCSYSDILGGIPRDYSYIIDSSGKLPEQLAQEGGRSGGSLSAREQEISGSIFLMEEAWDFSRRALSEAEAVWYRDIAEILGSFGDKVKLSEEGLRAGLTEESIDRIFQCVLNDHPELFPVF